MPLGSIALASWLTLVSGGPARSTTNNVVLIVIDDAGPELFGVYDQYYTTVTGQPSGVPAATPAIDAMLAAQGVTFTHAWANPVCSPTRATMLTGRYCYRTGIGGTTSVRPTPARRGLSYDQLLLPEALRAASPPYQSIALGKWHLAERSQLDTDPRHPLGSPPGRWFDAWAGTYFSIAAPEGLDPTITAYSIWKKSYAAYPHSQSAPCGPGAPPCQVQMVVPPISNYATADTAEDAIQCLREATGPLFLYVGFNGIHMPLHDVPVGLPAPTCASYVPPVTQCDYPPTLTANAERARCMLEAVDAQIGRLLCEVDFGKTTVILIGDNGTLKNGIVSPYPANHAKSTVFEGGVRVPMIIRSPLAHASVRGTYQSSIVQVVDLFATVCDIAGVPTPPTAQDSVSILPYLLQPAAPPARSFIYTESFYPHFTPDPVTGHAPLNFAAKHHHQAICDGRFKLIRLSRRNPAGAPLVTEKLYDLLAGGPPSSTGGPTADFFEQHNLLLDAGLALDAQAALTVLRGKLDTDFPFLTL